ncbi:MAG: hypothetical protein U1A06_14280 [Hoeflea sp.]|nr:hypothetical protein [Hoeflea sp.]
MWRRAATVLGSVVVIGTLGVWWALDRLGCEFNTAGCSTTLPSLNLEALLIMVPPLALGGALIWFGRSKG